LRKEQWEVKIPKKVDGEKIIVEFGVGLLAICVLGYAISASKAVMR